MSKWNRIKKIGAKAVLLSALAGILVVTDPGMSAFTGNDCSVVRADEIPVVTSSTTVSSAKAMLENYGGNLQKIYDFSAENKQKLAQIVSDAKTYLDNNPMTPDEMDAYVAQIKGQMDAFAAQHGTESKPLASTSEYIDLWNGLGIPSANYGQDCQVVLQIINHCNETLKDIVVTPQISTDPKVWPFEIEQTSYSIVIPGLPGNETSATLYENRQDIGWNFKVRSDVSSGYYELKFNVVYQRNGASEKAELTSYVKITGSPEQDAKSDTDPNTKTSTPRIIVTGFETNPAQVFAGDTFTLTLHVQNTSTETAVSNILFELEAASGGSDSSQAVAGVAPFLPTSGSSTIFYDSIAPGATIDITIEMTARADLSQKPYVLNVSMDYEDDKANPYKQTANVSIPIYQEAKFEVGSIEIAPNSIATYEQSNIMFSIYNTGKTTLYNVQVKFDEDVLTGGDVFLGKLDPGATGSVDTMVTAVATNDGTITAHISYEDESGNVATMDKDMELYIYEMNYDDDNMGGDNYDDPSMWQDDTTDSGSNNKMIYMIAGIAAGVIIIAVIVIIVVKKKSKKKKMLQELDNNTDDDEIL